MDNKLIHLAGLAAAMMLFIGIIAGVFADDGMKTCEKTHSKNTCVHARVGG